MNKLEMLEGAVSIIAGVIIKFLGGWDVLIKVLLICMVIDFVSGIMKAIEKKNVESRICLKGILKKFCIIIVVVVSVLLEAILKEKGIQTEAIRNIVITWFIVNECISILENVGEYTPIPDIIKDTLEVLKNSNTKLKDSEKKKGE